MSHIKEAIMHSKQGHAKVGAKYIQEANMHILQSIDQ